MTKTDALLYAPDRIRVNSIHPGFIWTPMAEHHLRDSGADDLVAARQQLDTLHPLGHVGEADDIAWAWCTWPRTRRSSSPAPSW